MTFDEFVNSAIAYSRGHHYQRVGQACMNALRWVRSDLWGTPPDIWEVDDWNDPRVMEWFTNIEAAW